MGKDDTLLNAVIGAVVTVVLSFTGISPLIGGGVAGYLQQGTHKSCAKVGALSGGIAFFPFLLLVFFGVVYLGILAGGFGIPGGVELLIIAFLFFPMIFLWSLGLGGIGGYLGAYLREELGSEDSHPST